LNGRPYNAEASAKVQSFRSTDGLGNILLSTAVSVQEVSGVMVTPDAGFAAANLKRRPHKVKPPQTPRDSVRDHKCALRL
jgi:hypothetical protein